jgi:hypothetical protein
MTYKEAIAILFQGQRVRRVSWPEYRYAILAHPPSGKGQVPFIHLHSHNGQFNLFHEHPEDIEATDWELAGTKYRVIHVTFEFLQDINPQQVYYASGEYLMLPEPVQGCYKIISVNIKQHTLCLAKQDFRRTIWDSNDDLMMTVQEHAGVD